MKTQIMMKESKKKNRLVILGSGTSTGVPITGCHCTVCSSTFLKNKRFRTSVLIKAENDQNILIDTTPDLRSQCLANGIESIDAVIITHDHADHVHGIDDLRPFCFGLLPKIIPLFTSPSCGENLTQRFPYIFQKEELFKDRPILGGGIPTISLHLIPFPKENPAGDPLPIIDIKGNQFQFFLLPHGHGQTLGFRHHRMAYLIDCQSIPDSVVEHLSQANLDLLIIDCLRRKPHSTHLHLDATLSYVQRIQPKAAGLIHFSHEFNHEDFEKELLQISAERNLGNLFPVYDGQTLEYNSIAPL